MRARCIGVGQTTVTVTVENLALTDADEDIIARARRVAHRPVAEDGHRLTRRTPTSDNPVAAVVTLDRLRRL